MSSRPTPSPTPSETTSTTPTSPTSGIAPCDAASALPALDSFWTVADGRRYHIELVYRGDEWVPPRTLPMPHHHASRIAWEGLETFPALSLAATQPHARVRFEITVLSRDIVADERDGVRVWFATYRARVEHVCRIDHRRD